MTARTGWKRPVKNIYQRMDMLVDSRTYPRRCGYSDRGIEVWSINTVCGRLDRVLQEAAPQFAASIESKLARRNELGLVSVEPLTREVMMRGRKLIAELKAAGL